MKRYDTFTSRHETQGFVCFSFLCCVAFMKTKLNHTFVYGWLDIIWLYSTDEYVIMRRIRSILHATYIHYSYSLRIVLSTSPFPYGTPSSLINITSLIFFFTFVISSICTFPKVPAEQWHVLYVLHTQKYYKIIHSARHTGTNSLKGKYVFDQNQTMNVQNPKLI